MQLLRAGRQPLSAAVVEVQRLLASSSASRGLLIVFTCYTVSTALSKVSLAYISVPLQVVVKSGKSAHGAATCCACYAPRLLTHARTRARAVIPVMAGGRFITGKRYSWAEYAGAVLLAAGVALFSGAGGNASAAARGGADALSIGLGLLAITLCADALLGNWQERTMKDAAITPSQLMLLQSLFAAALSAVAAVAAGEMEEGLALLRAEGGARIARLLVCYAAVMLLGTTAILTLVELRGAAAAVLVTLVRKCSSMFFSFLLWPKPLSARHILGAALVFAAPFASQRMSKAAAAAKTAREEPSKGASGRLSKHVDASQQV